MPSWLCKIWQLVSNILGKIVDFITSVLDTLINLAVKAIKGVVDAVMGGGLGSFLLYAAIGLGLYFLVRDKDDDTQSSQIEGVKSYAAPTSARISY